jgi:hypothetical protein
MTGSDLIDAARGARLWLAVQLRRLAYEIAVALFDRIAKGSALGDRQRTLLLGNLEGDLEDQIDDVRSGRPSADARRPRSWSCGRWWGNGRASGRPAASRGVTRGKPERVQI